MQVKRELYAEIIFVFVLIRILTSLSYLIMIILHVTLFDDLLIHSQAGNSPCTGGNGKSSSGGGEGSGRNRSILGSCIARTSSEEELQDPSKRPISPGHRGTTWNGKETYRKTTFELFIVEFQMASASL